MANITYKYTYKPSDEYNIDAGIEMLDMEEERVLDILNNRGFIISPSSGIKKELKDDYSIYSSKFGNKLSDRNKFINNFKCKCGYLTGSDNLDIECPRCGDKVKQIEDDPKVTGWMVIKDDVTFIIHPVLYRSIEFLIGKNDFTNIITFSAKVDEDGFVHKQLNETNQYFGIGMMEFHNKFDEIMEFYLKKNPKKIDYYNNIMENKGKVFMQSIPVFTTMLRPYVEDNQKFYYQDFNALYTKMNKYITRINMKSRDNEKIKEEDLLSLQNTYMNFYDKVIDVLSGKKGFIRSLFAGRFNFTSRSVIVSDPKLRIDQVKLSYYCLVVILQLSIINILKKTYSISYNDAYHIWFHATIKKDRRVEKIIQTMINQGEGIPMLINRNPTINHGSALQVYCVGMVDSYTMAIPLRILKLIAGDFDGDVLNILYIINKDLIREMEQVFNPNHTIAISNNDGKFNNSVNHQRDTIINSNSFISLGKNIYGKEDLENINRILNKKIII